MNTLQIRRLSPSPFLLLPLLLAACGDDQLGPERVPTVPVHGQVLIDGEPAENVRVTFHPVSQAPGTESIYTAQPKDMTDKQGRFEISTYVQGDGAVEGTYQITFEKLRYDAFRNRYSGPDQLGGRYADPVKSEFQATVTGGGGVVKLEPFELTLNEKGGDKNSE